MLNFPGLSGQQSYAGAKMIRINLSSIPFAFSKAKVEVVVGTSGMGMTYTGLFSEIFKNGISQQVVYSYGPKMSIDMPVVSSDYIEYAETYSGAGIGFYGLYVK
jgi:hypothetical protein